MKNDNYNQIFIIRNTKTQKVFARINEEFFAIGNVNLKEGLDIFSRFIRKQKQSFSFNFLFSVTDSQLEVMVVLEEERFYSIYESLKTFFESCVHTDLWLYKDTPNINEGCSYCMVDPDLSVSQIDEFFSTNFLPGKSLIEN